MARRRAGVGFPGGRAHALHTDRAGTLWVAADDRLARLPAEARRFQTLPMAVGRVSRIAEGPDGTLWIAESNGGVRSVHLSADQPVRTLWTQPATDLGFDRHGGLWITTLGDGLVRIPAPLGAPAVHQRYIQREGLSSDALRAVLEDREGNLWLGSSQGLDRLRRSALRAVPVPTGAQAFVVAAHPDGLWLGSRNRPLQQLRDGALQPGAGPTALTAVLQEDRRTWWGGEDGLWQLMDGQLRQVATLPPEVGQSGVQALAADGAGGVWASLNRPGLYRWHAARWTHTLHPAYPVGASPLILHTGSDGALWLGFSHSRQVRQDAHGVQVFDPAHGLRIGHVTALAPCADRLCIGGAAGLAWTDGARVQAVLPGVVRTAIWERSGHGLDGVPADRVMEAEDLVQAALRGLDLGEHLTIPSLSDIELWDQLVRARRAMVPQLSVRTPAVRYRTG